MVHIYKPCSSRGQLSGQPTSIVPDPHRVIFCSTIENKPFQNNKEIKTSPRNSQILHIGCLCLLQDESLAQPRPRHIRPDVPHPPDANKRLQDNTPYH